MVCAWDGTTYILDHLRNVVRFKFEDNVCAFCAGKLGHAQATSTTHSFDSQVYSDLVQNITSTVSFILTFLEKSSFTTTSIYHLSHPQISSLPWQHRSATRNTLSLQFPSLFCIYSEIATGILSASSKTFRSDSFGVHCSFCPYSMTFCFFVYR